METRIWKLCKNGNLIKSKSGQFVDRMDYDNLLMNYRSLKKELNLNNFSLKVCHLLDNLNLKAQEKLAVTMYFQGLQFFIESLMNKNENNNIS